MSLKTSSLIATAVLATTAFGNAAQADAGHAVDACVKSFISAYLPGRTVRQVQKDRSEPTRVEQAYFRNYTVALAAYGAKTGTLLAEARCVASNGGHVIVLDNPPTSEYVAQADFVVAVP